MLIETPRADSSNRFADWLVVAFLAALLVAIYLPHLGADLIFDDARLTDGSVYGVYGSFDAIRQRFLSFSSFPWLTALVGEGWWKQRLFNLVAHAGVAVGIFCFTRELLLKIQDRIPTRVLWLCVGLFALHPVAVYGVGYLIQRSIVMAALFGVWALFAVSRGLRIGSPGWLLASIPLYALAVLSKEYAITLATCVVPLYLYLRRPSVRGIAWGLAGLLLVGVAAFSFLYPIYKQILGTAFDETSLAYLRQLELLQPGITQNAHALSIANQCLLFFRYGLFWIFPNVLGMSVDLRPSFPLSLASMAAIAGIASYAAALLGGVYCALQKQGRPQLAGVLLVLPLLLYSTEFVLVWVQDPMVLYRSYLWAVALPGLWFLLVTTWVPDRARAPVLVICCLVLTALAFERAHSLRTPYAAWDDAARKISLDAPANAVGRWRPFLNRGTELLERGNLAAAVADFTQAVQLGEPNGSAAMNLGVALQLSKQFPQALAWFDKAQTMGFTEPMLYFHMAESQLPLGQAAAALDNYAKALAAGISAELAAPIREKRAGAAMAAKRFDVALEDYRLLSAAEPQAVKYKVGVNFSLINLGRAREAVDGLSPLIEAQPNAHQALYTRALAFEALNDRPRALKDVDAALALQPGNPLYQSVRNRLAGASPAPVAGTTPARK